MHGKLIVILTLIDGATSCILCGRYEIMLFEKGLGPKSTASDQQIIDFETIHDKNIMDCFIDTFSNP